MDNVLIVSTTEIINLPKVCVGKNCNNDFKHFCPARCEIDEDAKPTRLVGFCDRCRAKSIKAGKKITRTSVLKITEFSDLIECASNTYLTKFYKWNKH